MSVYTDEAIVTSTATKFVLDDYVRRADALDDGMAKVRSARSFSGRTGG
jgi:hypothetical protein